ncbi:MAG: LamG domain-containing protein [Streptosporangiaceae bacterium]
MLTAHWSFEDDTIVGTGRDRRALDLTGSGLSALLDEKVAIVPGRAGRALSFHGSDRAVIPAAPRLALSQLFGFSMTFFLKVADDPTGQWRGVLYKPVAPRDARGMGIWLYPDDLRLRGQLFTMKGGAEYADSRSALPRGTWTHVAIVVDPDEIYLYLNGSLDVAVRLDHPVVSPAGPIYLGCDPTGLGFTGLLADLRIYATALTGEAIGVLASERLAVRLEERELDLHAVRAFGFPGVALAVHGLLAEEDQRARTDDQGEYRQAYSGPAETSALSSGDGEDARGQAGESQHHPQSAHPERAYSERAEGQCGHAEPARLGRCRHPRAVSGHRHASRFPPVAPRMCAAKARVA